MAAARRRCEVLIIAANKSKNKKIKYVRVYPCKPGLSVLNCGSKSTRKHDEVRLSRNLGRTSYICL